MPTLIASEELLKKLAPLVVTASRGMQVVATQQLIERDGIGIIAIASARVKAMASMSDDDFAKAIQNYKWVADKPVDWIPLPWQVVARKSDDCDGSAVLCCATRPACVMYLICRVENGMPLNFSDWHYIAVQKIKSGYIVWSNFKRNIYKTQAEYRAWIKREYPWASMLVEVDPQLKGNPRACIKSFSAL